MNVLIKKIAIYNFRVVYPLLYRTFLQQYNIIFINSFIYPKNYASF